MLKWNVIFDKAKSYYQMDRTNWHFHVKESSSTTHWAENNVDDRKMSWNPARQNVIIAGSLGGYQKSNIKSM